MAIFSTRERDGLPPAPHATANKRGIFSVIGPDVVITGNLAATADLHIDGRVDGDVQCGALVQGIDSRITGAVTAETARLAGMIHGSVAVRQLTIERAARITGDVEYETISVENGATVDGRLTHVAAGSTSGAFARPEPAAAPPLLEGVVQFTATGHAA